MNFIHEYYISALQSLQLALFLASYKKMSPEIAVKIFNKEFIDRLDEKKSTHYSLLILARLNQVTSILYPQYKIPWFNDKAMSYHFKKFHLHEWVLIIFRIFINALENELRTFQTLGNLRCLKSWNLIMLAIFVLHGSKWLDFFHIDYNSSKIMEQISLYTLDIQGRPYVWKRCILLIVSQLIDGGNFF